MKRMSTLLLPAVLAGALEAPDLAQQFPAASPPVRSSVDAVAAELDVLVLDAKGRPVEGLARSEFSLFVNGKETPVDWLEGPPSRPAPAAPADGSFFRKVTNFAVDRRWKGRLFVGVRDTATSRFGAVALPIGM